MFKALLFAITIISVSLIAAPWGKDADLANYKPQTKQTKKTSPSPLRLIFNGIIVFHQKVISPVDGPRSHFVPSSSQYARDAINKYGFFQGYIMACDRLLRENPDLWEYPTIQQKDADIKYDPVR